MSMKQTMIGHRTPHIPDLEELLQAYTEVQMTQRAPEWHFLPYLDEILFELPKCDRF